MKKTEKRSIILNLDDYEWLKLLENEQIGRLFLALYKKYRGEKYVVTTDIRVPFSVISTSIDQYNERWETERQRRSEMGKKGNLVRWKSQSIAKVADKDKEYVKEYENEIIEIKRFFLFTRLLCPVNDEFARFWDHYEKNSWLDGNGVLITNKLACARNWKTVGKAITDGFSKHYAKAWQHIYDLLEAVPGSSLLVTDINGFRLKGQTLTIICSQLLYDFIEKNINEKVFLAIKKEFGCELVDYQIIK